MTKKTTLLLIFSTLFYFSKAQQHITYFNFLDYSAKWKYGAYYNNPSGSGKWKEVFHIKGDTSIANEWYYKVFMQYQLYDNNNKLQKLSTTFAYNLREDKDSILYFIYPNGNKFSINHSTSDLEKSYPYKKEYPKGEIPFSIYYENQQFGPSCGIMQGIGNTNCPPSTNGVIYFECYTKNGKSSDIIGEKCNIELLTTSATNDTKTGNIHISPNPFDHHLYLKIDDNFALTENTSYYIYDMKGVLQKNAILSADTSIDTSDIQAGIYILNINTLSDRLFYKIVK
jgi:Secretion system C-terminal sorting domain